ncbi:MAG TPA: hypothetical protein VI386_17770 [Candidatus Sulfotelmatobacter sp.]
MEFWLSSDAAPIPERKRKLVTNALEAHEEYNKLKAVIMGGRMRPHQTAVITMGPKDAEALGFKWPWRTATDNLRRFVRSMGLEADFEVRKYETATTGVWAITATYNPPMVKTAVPRPEVPAVEKRRPGRPITRTA